MCLAIMMPVGANVPDEHLRNGWDNNSDGAGYMFVAGGKLVIRKPYYRFKTFKADYTQDKAEFGDLSPFVVHFRFGTHGDFTEVNVHPHSLCNGNVGLVHNGVLSEFDGCIGKEDLSDTAFFCRTVLALRKRSQLLGGKFGQYLADLIGTENKLVMLGNDGRVSIINDGAGVWDGNIWYSNTYSLKPRKKIKLLPPGKDNVVRGWSWLEDTEASDELAWQEACLAMDKDGTFDRVG